MPAGFPFSVSAARVRLPSATDCLFYRPHMARMTPADILGPQGRIAQRLAGYEHRPEQLAMADAVTSAIDRGRHLVVEAGTGVGKSFAYLVPAILAAADPEANGGKRKRIVVSTH